MNFVKYTPDYDTAECAEDWAKKTIAEHAKDKRSGCIPSASLKRRNVRRVVERSADANG